MKKLGQKKQYNDKSLDLMIGDRSIIKVNLDESVELVRLCQQHLERLSPGLRIKMMEAGRGIGISQAKIPGLGSQSPKLDGCVSLPAFANYTGQEKPAIRTQIKRGQILAFKKSNGQFLIPLWQWNPDLQGYYKGVRELVSSFHDSVEDDEKIWFMNEERIRRLKDKDWSVLDEAASLGAF